MSYRLFLRTFRAGMQYDAYHQLQLLNVVSFPNWKEDADRQRYRQSLVSAAGLDHGGAESAKQDLENIKQLQLLFPTPSPEVLEDIKREQTK